MKLNVNNLCSFASFMLLCMFLAERLVCQFTGQATSNPTEWMVIMFGLLGIKNN